MVSHGWTPAHRPFTYWRMVADDQHCSKTTAYNSAEERFMALDPKVLALLSRPNFAHLATLMPDGSPNTTPVWIGVRGDQVVIGTGETSLKVRNLRRDPRLSLSVVDFHDPYEEVQIRGRVVEFRDDSKFEIMDEISHKYTGKPFPFRNPEGRVALMIAVEKARYQAALPKHAAVVEVAIATLHASSARVFNVNGLSSLASDAASVPCRCAGRARRSSHMRAARPPRSPARRRGAPAIL